MTRLVLALASLFLAAPLAAAPAMYRYDTVHSQVLFSASHNSYSSPVGRLHVAGGWLRFDMDDWSHAATELDIDLTSVDMGEAQWNQALRGDEFLDTARAPLAHFRSTSVTRTGKRSGLLRGELTLRGVTQPVQIAFTVNRIGGTVFGMHSVAGFSARATLRRTDFGIDWFPSSVGQQVQLRLEIEAIRDDQAMTHYRQQEPAHAAEK